MDEGGCEAGKGEGLGIDFEGEMGIGIGIVRHVGLRLGNLRKRVVHCCASSRRVRDNLFGERKSHLPKAGILSMDDHRYNFKIIRSLRY